MQIYYINRRLTQYHSAPGLWGRQVLFGLRRSGAAVSSYPAIARSVSATALTRVQGQPEGVGRYRSLLMAHYSRHWVAWLLEGWMMARGAASTISGTLWALWHRGRFESDIILGRQTEYEATPQLVALVLGRPLVLEVHSIHFIERQMRGRRPSRLMRAFECWQWRRASRIWVNSETLKSIIVQHGISPIAVRVISFGVDLERFAPRRRANTGSNNELRVIFVGSFYAWHGVPVLLRAFAAAHKRARGLRLTLVGDGAERGSSEALARELGITQAVEFTGWLSYDQVVERLRRANIGVAPYLRIEPFYFDPAKIIEYMAAGLAVVASDQGRVAEMVKDEVSGILVPPGDEAGLTAALLRLANDEGLRARLGEAARQRAETLFCWPEISKQVLALCAEAARGS